MREAHKPRHRFDVTITDPRRPTHTGRARCGCGWSALDAGPMADAVAAWHEHVATAKKEEQR